MEIYISKEAQKQYLKLVKFEKNKVNKKLLLLSSDPYSGKKLSGEYKETRSLKTWPYRIIYYINKKRKEIWIISILHRQGAYG
jgi:addiction module RelE/StbE family toxin